MSLYTMKEILGDAQQKSYAIGYFNAVNMEMVRACITAAEDWHAPIIIGTAEALLPYADFKWIVPIMLEQAEKAKVPVAVHLDHTYRFEVLMEGLQAGFGSVMYDGFRLPDHVDNICNSREIVRIAHAMGVGVECELGSVGGLSDETGKEDKVVYTNPEEAQSFLEETGADFLAVSIGTQHGVYKAKPQLDIPRLKEIRARVDAPLVLHGGSGLSDEDIRQVIAAGICKINVFTDVILAAKEAVAAQLEKSYTDLNLAAEKAMRDVTADKLRLFGSANRY